jgi:hypothetical protein
MPIAILAAEFGPDRPSLPGNHPQTARLLDPDPTNLLRNFILTRLPRAPRPSGIAFLGTRPPARKRRRGIRDPAFAPNGRCTLGKRTRKLASGASEMGQLRTHAAQQ